MQRRIYPVGGIALLVVLLLSLVVGCGQSEELAATSAPPTVPQPTPSPLPKPIDRPEHILATWPLAGVVLPLEQYQSAELRRDVWPRAKNRDWDMPYQPCICAWIDLDPLLEEGDDYGGGISDRTVMVVDGNTLDREDLVFEFMYLLYAETWQQGWTKPAITSGGPHHLCWSVDLAPGFHEATVTFQKTSGAQVSYSWFFEITADG